jgi:large subunit ribosomal protein L13
MLQKSSIARPGELRREWFEVDASDQVVGRLSTRIARILMGKHKATYTPFLDTGDFVVVTHVEKLRFTGQKLAQKPVYFPSRRPGGLRSKPLGEIFEKRPENVLRQAVKRMLPKTSLGEKMLKKLKIVQGATHPFAAQKLRAIDLSSPGPGFAR